MIWVTVAVGVVAILLALYSLWLFRELRTWARLARDSRIIVSYKNRIILQDPLTNWMKWAQMLDKDELASGRVVYRNSNTVLRVAGRRAFSKAVITDAAIRASK